LSEYGHEVTAFAPRKSPTYLVSRITSISRAPPPRCAGDTHPKVGPSAMRPSPATARAGGTWCGRRSVGKGCGGVYDHPRPPSTHRLRPTPHLTPIRAHSVAHRVPGRRVAQGCASRRWPARGAGRQKCGEFAADFTYKVVGMDDIDPLNPPPPARNHPPSPLRAVRARASDAENGQFEMIACPIELYTCHPCVARR